MSDRLQDVVAGVLRLPPESITDDIGFGLTPEWDSLNHISLMLAIEEAYGITLSDDDVVELTTVGAIRSHLGRAPGVAAGDQA